MHRANFADTKSPKSEKKFSLKMAQSGKNISFIRNFVALILLELFSLHLSCPKNVRGTNASYKNRIIRYYYRT